jgi:EH domain-containing protein 1
MSFLVVLLFLCNMVVIHSCGLCLLIHPDRIGPFLSPALTAAGGGALSLAKPQVLLVGQYSVGKTSFIRYLLGRDFPGQRIGPEPTTDRFTVLLNGPEERTIPGNALSVHPDLPFRGLEKFGVNFLSRLEGSQLPSSVLRSITLIDTPGILSGEKQRVNRGYDFTKGLSFS